MTSVGQLPGLRPRRRPRDGGEAAGGDVDLVDALDPLAWRTVAAWLHGKPSAATRQVGLQVLASFLSWLRDTEPALELLAVTGAQLDAYCEVARTGALTRRPLASRTVARKRSVLLSFYTFAWQCGVVRHNQVPGQQVARNRRGAGTRTLTRDERRQLRQGIARLAADGRTAEAAAVALLELTGAAVDALAGLTRQDVHSVAGGSRPAVITVHHGRDDVVAFPVSPLARPLLRVLCASRPAGEPLIRRSDGRPVDLDWLRGALADAALAGGVPEQRARDLHPHMLRAATVTDLLEDAKAMPSPPPRP
ncbi:tyrosine-type recombinase/integrase [Nonomuraea turcica]|uniref:tyrosine-type recombinase/integrase n=1 Tax=Nonomuraea sp. G32 TaxID=3067274 RepID=UPI00273B4F8D|nr:site-specific integrase [Nonomuraea sp. G32]MDP4506802.1 site-specific integrase [Nonomuraea sp. G32]